MPLINVEEKKYVRVRNSNILQIYYLDFATNFWETGQMNLRLLETKNCEAQEEIFVFFAKVVLKRIYFYYQEEQNINKK